MVLDEVLRERGSKGHCKGSAAGEAGAGTEEATTAAAATAQETLAELKEDAALSLPESSVEALESAAAGALKGEILNKSSEGGIPVSDHPPFSPCCSP